MFSLPHSYFLELIYQKSLLGELIRDLDLSLVNIIDSFKVVVGKHAELLQLAAVMLTVSVHQVENTVLSLCNLVKRPR